MRRYDGIQGIQLKKAVFFIGLLVFSLILSSCVPRPKQSSEPTEQSLPSQSICPEEERTEEQRDPVMSNSILESDLPGQTQSDTNAEMQAQDNDGLAEEIIEEETSSEQKGGTPDSTEITEDTLPANSGGIELPDDPIDD